jgi:peptide methionine sulfoxide reductase msrA/msrB
MKQLSIILTLFTGVALTACAQQNQELSLTDLPPVITDPSQYNELTDAEAGVILHKGTERAFSGKYHDLKEEGIYICKQCNQPLFRSSDKFDSGTGWPSFDDTIEGAVKEIPDADGMRTEIVCSNCGAHLGHVFRGEGFTPKQTRHCVNSLSLNFVPAQKEQEARKDTGVQPIAEYIKGKGYEQYEVATFAGGCFWCVEASFERIEGVVDVISGYSGGEKAYPTYEEVSSRKTKYAESIQVYYDPAVIDFPKLLEVFFVAHDPTQLNRQGPDVGPQYRSEIFYHGTEQKELAEAYIKELDNSGKFDRPVVTALSPYKEFWVAEAYHQDYYEHHPENPYIQSVSRPKVEKVEKEFADILKDAYRKKQSYKGD